MEEQKREDEKKNKEGILIELARESIKRAIEKGQISVVPPEVADEEIERFLKQKKGVFVTLREEGEVRGCIGTFVKDELWVQVQRYAFFSAFNDPRFPAVEKDEIDKIKIEISIIEEEYDVSDIKDIELGKDGIILELKGRGGVLLPEVAVEYGLKKPEEFLDMLCRKIGLSPGCWKNAKIKKFRTTKIIE